MASAEVPKPVSEKTVASASHLSSTEGAAPRSSSDDVKGSTGEAAAAADRNRGHYNPIPSLFVAGDVMDMGQFSESAMRDILKAQAADGGGLSSLTLLSRPGGGGVPVYRLSPGGRFWESKEDADVVQLKMAMPGLGKEHVTMKAEKDTLVIKGEGGDDKRCSYRVGLSSQAFKLDQSKAEMKNGVLMVTVPKIKVEYGVGIRWVLPGSHGCSPHRSCSSHRSCREVAFIVVVVVFITGVVVVSDAEQQWLRTGGPFGGGAVSCLM